MSANGSMRLPDKASLEQLKKQAKERVASGNSPSLSEAQLALARSYGFESWPKLRVHLDQRRLRRLIQDGEPGPVAALLKASPRLARLPFPEGDTPLHVAAEENRPALVEMLAQHGATLDARYANSAHNALSWALTSESFEAAEKLVELGLEPDLFCAAGLGRLDLVKGFWKGGELKPRPSRTGSSRFDPNWTKRLPCPPESDADQVSDALYIACRAGRHAVAEWLLDHGADPNFRGYVGATCLAWAEFSEDAKLCARLRQGGGSDEIRDFEFQARPHEFPIMVFSGWGFRDRLTRRLQRNPAEVATATPAGTPLHAAASHGQELSVRLLLACGADKSAKKRPGGNRGRNRRASRPYRPCRTASLIRALRPPAGSRRSIGALIASRHHLQGDPKMTRRRFLTTVPAAGLISPIAGSLSSTPAELPSAIHAAYPSQNPERAREFVGVCHGNLAKVQEMLKESAKYALAATDWGFGDWESALGAASHVGHTEIAALLIQHGARPDLFYHAMMGQLDAVKAAIEARPGLQRVLGPHGITLLDHARAGGSAAKATVDYLESLGDADPQRVSLPVSKAEKQRYLGRYAFGPGADDSWIVELGREGDLRIKRGEHGIQLVMHRVEEHGFAPPGNRELRIRFKVEGEKATSVAIYDPELVVEAVRA